MRRQSKPFVTEYKSSPRRAKDVFEPDPPRDAAFALEADVFRSPASAEDDHDAVMRAADALFSPKPPATPAVDEATDATAPKPQRGRILQAIEEVPVDPFAELEALHAPKRRGRKPGSKNKPKPAMAANDTHPVPRPARATAPAPALQQQVAMPTLQAVPVATGRRVERFAWVRTTLRPGERWKRRIPKVAW